MTRAMHQDFSARAAAEVVNLHIDLQSWFRAEGEQNPDRVLAHFQQDYRMVGAAGRVVTYDDMASALPRMWGSRPTLVMEISDVRLQHVAGSTGLVTYLETQTESTGVTRRFSSALLRDEAGDAHPTWLFLQETFCG